MRGKLRIAKSIAAEAARIRAERFRRYTEKL
jgi:hypothetical protein